MNGAAQVFNLYLLSTAAADAKATNFSVMLRLTKTCVKTTTTLLTPRPLPHFTGRNQN